ncbi:hypothetical protein NWE47_05690 [Escherichia coli]|nr:hypothetical protein [Escherichia coli]
MSAQAWQDEMRYAGVSSFGIGGTNCHMIVASLPDALNARLPNRIAAEKVPRCCSAPPATARCGGWRRIMPGR